MARYKRQNKANIAKRRGKYRSILEKDVHEKLAELGYEAAYEPYFMPYIVPMERHKYKPDFVLFEDKVIIEAKGRFVAADRKKMLLLKEQYPDKRIILLFSNAREKIGTSPRSKTYGEWAEKHGFLWGDFKRDGIKEEWFDDL